MSGPLDRRLLETPGASGPPRDGGAPSALDTALGILHRRWPVIVAAVLIVTAVATLRSATQEKVYSATASILFQAEAKAFDGGNTLTDPQRVAATNEELLSLPAVARGAADGLGADPGEVSSAVEIDSSKESDIVEIQASSSDQQRAARIANAYGDAFIRFRRDGARERIDEALAGARKALADLSFSQAAGQGGDDLRDRINSLETTRSLQTGGASLVSRAEVPGDPSSPKPLRSGILGLILGAIVGLAMAALLERRDKSIKDPEGLELAFGRPVVAEIPRSSTLARAGMPPLAGEEAEAFRMLRTNLRYFSVDADLRSLLIASAESGEGKSTVARRLAETMAAMGDSVVLVEADLHRQSAFGLSLDDEDVGLSTVLIGGSLDDALADYPVRVSDTGDERLLTVLRTGPAAPNPSELLESEIMREVMVELQARFGVVIVDSPPLPVVSDALPLVSQLDGVLAVGAVGKTSSDGVRNFLRLLTLHGGNLIGVVVNFASRSDRSTSAAYYGDPRAERPQPRVTEPR